MYRRRKIRQQRLALLAVILAVVVTGLSALGWWIVQSTMTAFKAPSDTQALQAKLEEDFGFIDTPSLLYTTRGSMTMPLDRLGGTLQDKLLPIIPSREDTVLRDKLQALIDSFPPGHFTPYLYYFNPDDGSYVSINGYEAIQAASVIKLPVLLVYLMDLDKDRIALDSPLLYQEYHRAGGAGELQYQTAGISIPAHQVAREMIRISDNTSTNILIASLGGSDVVNRTLHDMGLRQTRIRNWLPDLEGTNTISAYEMATILYNIDRGTILSDTARHMGLQILQSPLNKRLLPALLPPDVKVAHKTGDIGTALGDSGLFYLPDGRRFILSMHVHRPYNDYTAKELFQRAALTVYAHYNQTSPAGEAAGVPVQ